MKSRRKRIRAFLIPAALVICMTFSFFSAAPLRANASHDNDSSANKMHYWAFDGNASDASGTLDLSSNNQVEFAEGKHDKALNTAEGSAVRSGVITDNTLRGFSMGAWFTLNSGATEWNIIISKGNTQDNLPERFQVHIGHASESEGGGQLLAYIPGAGGGLSSETDGVFVPYDTWTYVTVTYDLSTVRMYVNGELAAEKEAKGSLDVSQAAYNTVSVGALNHDGDTFRFNGVIDDAFYANYPMTAADVKESYDDVAALKAWSDGSKEIVPDTMEEIAQPTAAPTTPPDVNKGKMVFFWPFEGDTKDYSHYAIEMDSDDSFDGFVDGKAGKGLYTEATLLSDPLPDNIDLTNFTVSMWVKWEENSHGTYTVPLAIALKETSHHFELYYTVDGDQGELAFYGTGNGLNIEKIAPVERDVYNHIAAVNSGNSFRVFLNGEVVYSANRTINMRGLGSAGDIISIAGLNDRTLTCAGEYDEIVLADYAFSDELIQKLYSDPAGAHEEVIKLVEDNYPEGYTRPTEKPVSTPEITNTPAPTQSDEPVVTAAPTEDAGEDVKTPIPGKATESGKDTDDKRGGINPGVIIAVISGIVIVAAVTAAILIAKKKK